MKNNRGQLRRGGGSGAMLLQNDKNRDGLISKAELPEQFKAMMVRVDRNQDMVIDKAEFAWMEKHFVKRVLAPERKHEISLCMESLLLRIEL